jgi:EAL and modified HD-GYP domain-containing signal transduction protein
MPMTEILNTLPLSSEIQDALMFYKGDLGKLLQCSIAYENADWEKASQIDEITTAELRDSYFNALAHAQNSLSLLE